MTTPQELHLLQIINTASKLISTKYRAGQKQHGGNLFDKSASELVDEALNECIDQMVYLLTAKAKLDAISLSKNNLRSVGDIPSNENLS